MKESKKAKNVERKKRILGKKVEKRGRGKLGRNEMNYGTLE